MLEGENPAKTDSLKNSGSFLHTKKHPFGKIEEDDKRWNGY